MSFNLQKETSTLLEVLIAHKKTIRNITFAALLTALMICIFKPWQYYAETTFILKNPLFADRSYLYSKDMRYINYYAPEDDIERMVALKDADNVIRGLISELKLNEYYKTDTTTAKGWIALKKKINKKVKIIRTPEKHAILFFRDKDPVFAAKVANKYLELIELNMRKNYNQLRADVFQSLQTKVKEEDSTLALLTDSLARMRAYYRIYDIVNPARHNMLMSAHIQDNGHPGFAYGLELIQNLESVKDRLVVDRADHISLANQYSSSVKINDLSLIQIIKAARPPVLSYTDILSPFLIVGFIGFCFSIFYVLIRHRNDIIK